TRVDDDDAVVGRTDLAHALQTDLDGHVGGYTSDLWWARRLPRWGSGRAASPGTHRLARERAGAAMGTARHCARSGAVAATTARLSPLGYAPHPVPACQQGRR